MKKTLIYLMVLVLTTTIGNVIPAAAQTTDNTVSTRMDGIDADDDGDNGRWGLAGLLGLLGLLGLRKRDDHTHTVKTTSNTNR